MSTRLTPEQSALVDEWYFLVDLMAGAYGKRLPARHDDLVSWGVFGLIRAAQTWDPELAGPGGWRSWASTKIRGAMLDAVRTEVGWRTKAGWRVPLSLERLQEEDLWDPPAPEDPLIAAVEDAGSLASLLALLTPAQLRVAELMLKGHNQRTSAAALGVTESRVSQIMRSIREQAYGMWAA